MGDIFDELDRGVPPESTEQNNNGEKPRRGESFLGPREQERRRQLKQQAEKRARRQERIEKLIPKSFYGTWPEPIFLVVPFVFFTGSVFWLELLLRLTNGSNFLLGPGFFRSIFSSMACGMLLFLVTTILPNKKLGARIAAGFLFLLAFFAMAECCVKDYFGNYFQVTYMFSMGGQIAGNFLSEAIGVVKNHLLVILLAFLPGVLCLLGADIVVPRNRPRNPRRKELWILQGILLVVLQLLNIFLCHLGNVENYTTQFTANTAIPHYGLVNTLRLEVQYGLFGQPMAELETDDVLLTTSEEDEEDEEELIEEEAEPIVYDDNVLDIDFETLIAYDTDSTLKAMDEYFSSQIPTSQNEYTGLFEGKNLIMITAEAFSYAVIDEELTPALYQLTTTGFVFTNFYQPDWSQSTTGGEYSLMTGLLPTWIDGGTSFKATASNSMPYGLGWIFSSMGYSASAYHNNTYTYYSRSLTHPNLGYNYIGIGNGLEIESSAHWPASDLEMLQATIEEDIQAYVEDGTPFHTYYMSVSGHCEYGWNSNRMSLKNQDAVADLDYSETVKAYIACQLELEYALEYLLDALETAGILEDTVIVMGPDHYPYALAEDTTDYYVELTGIDDTEKDTSRYLNTLIIWSGSMEEPVVVDTPCTGIDVLPTVLNLFGVEYDSRLLSGRDILAEDVAIGEVASNMHVAIFANLGYGYSWITAAGTYESSTKTFTANPGVVLEDEEAYVSAVKKLIQNRYTYAEYIVTKDYYSHIFSNWSSGKSLAASIG